MAFAHGKKAFVSVQDSGAVTRDISTYLDSVSHPFSQETAETTTFMKDHKTYLPGLMDTTVSVSGKWDSVVDGYLFGLLAFASTRTMIVGPAGSTGGFVKYTFAVIMTGYNVSTPVGDVVTFTADWQVSDIPTRGTF